ncbi:hypothetical protein ACRE_002310 [Hapsidospora chrysogenum ATCC 11550]|uniref:Uncharacterized protein n=1 Tax=Hapsidospora chrysogenum (strain ATCC 11550 / CBS 779.69 / DSM 880 / IAM 14645 / JCM 23072 / IMI 49137) TaxID=857340 RepID=A0A086TI03_HAPC1|nr:hypothetical protein ACRE_002310 [Hapsidospora chrysogenum ATCC 11550]
MSATTTTSTTTTTTTTRPKHVSFQPSPVISLRQSTLKKKDMSITQTYYLAHKARAKLSREAAQPDHDLRLLVGHANLLDTLMFELADAEREQERWFNQSVRATTDASPEKKQQERHIQWADSIAESPMEDDDEEEEEEEEEEYDSDTSSDDDLDEDDRDFIMTAMPSLRPAPSAPRTASTPANIQTLEISQEEEEEEEEDDIMEDDLEEDYAQLGLVRTSSHSNSPPELVDEWDSSEDESMPPSPQNALLPMPAAVRDTKESEREESLYDEDYYLPRRTTPAGMVSAISVY